MSTLHAKTVTGDLKTLDKKDISRALDFAIDEFENKGTQLKISNLDEGYAQYIAANEAKLKEFKSIIERVSFSQFFQPVVDMKTKEATHYEILSRFESGDTQEWIRFGEDAGPRPRLRPRPSASAPSTTSNSRLVTRALNFQSTSPASPSAMRNSAKN
jgi:hypothetical protein